MRNTLLILSLIVVAVVAGCGSDEGDEASQGFKVAIRVGDVEISDAVVARTIRELWPLGAGDGGTKVRPPDFTACVDAKQPQTESQAEYERRVCKELYEAHERFAVSHLIQLTWARMEARARGLEPTKADLRRMMNRQLDTLTPAAVRQVRGSEQRRRALLASVETGERNRRLVEALNTTPESLSRSLARRFEDRTRCAPRYRVVELPECTGALAVQ